MRVVREDKSIKEPIKELLLLGRTVKTVKINLTWELPMWPCLDDLFLLDYNQPHSFTD